METVLRGGGCFFRFPLASYGRIFVRNNFYIIKKNSLGTKLGTQLIQLGFLLMQYITLSKRFTQNCNYITLHYIIDQL